MKIDYVRSSSINTYKWCEWKHYLEYVLGHESKPTQAAFLGSVVHKVLEILSRCSINERYYSSKYWNVDYLLKISFDHYAKKYPYVVNKTQPKQIRQLRKGVMKLLASPYSPIHKDTIASEQRFNINFPQVNIRGTIDRIDRFSDGILHIVDYKTGLRQEFGSLEGVKKDSSVLNDDVQPRTYFLAASQLYPKIDSFLITFYYLTDGGPVTTFFHRTQVSEVLKEITDYYQDIRRNNHPVRTRDWRCKTLCPFGRDGTCDKIWYKEKYGQ